jgi:hypothetical protein
MMLLVLCNQYKCNTFKTIFVETLVTDQSYIYGDTMQIYFRCEIWLSRFINYEDFYWLQSLPL